MASKPPEPPALDLVSNCQRCNCPITPNVKEHAYCPSCRYRKRTQFETLTEPEENDE